MTFLKNSCAPLGAVALFALLLAGCAGSGASAPSLSSGTAGAVRPADSTAGATSCGTALGNFEKVISSDADTGNLNRSVYERMVADLRPVKASCTAGKDAQALAQLATVRARYGYP